MTKVIFDGEKEAERMASFLEESERLLGKSLIIFQCDGRTDESLYVKLKKEMGERLGVMVGVIYPKDSDELREMIQAANNDETIDGILVQLPVLGVEKTELEQILCSIKPSKDIDGLNPKSGFVPAVVRATERLLESFKVSEDDSIVIVGARGSVGSRLLDRLKVLGYRVSGIDKDEAMTIVREADVVISATGVPGVVKPEDVADRFVGIDLGYPKADFSPEAADKASLITPVPKGVGPMTVVAMYENLADA